MRDFENSFDAALAGVDRTIVEVMGLCAQFTSGAQCGSEVQGVFDDPESLGFAGSGVRIEGSSPSLFVRTDTVRAVRRGDTLTINGETFWVDRVSPDDGGSCYLWLNRGQPPAVTWVALGDAAANSSTLFQRVR
ncbi:head-tail joining protein [Escherichia coli]